MPRRKTTKRVKKALRKIFKKKATMAPSCYLPTHNESQTSVQVTRGLEQPELRRVHHPPGDVEPASTSTQAAPTSTCSTRPLGTEHYKPIKKRKIVWETVDLEQNTENMAELRKVATEPEEDSSNANENRPPQDSLIPDKKQRACEHHNYDISTIITVERLDADATGPLPPDNVVEGSANYEGPLPDGAEPRAEYAEAEGPVLNEPGPQSGESYGGRYEVGTVPGAMRIHSSADTEAALDLLSLAAGVPPLPPPPPPPPIYHPVQPANIYIMTEPPQQPTNIYHAIQAEVAPMQQVEHGSLTYPMDAYVTYEQGEGVHLQPLYGALSSPPLVLGEPPLVFEPLVLEHSSDDGGQSPFIIDQPPVSNFIVEPIHAIHGSVIELVSMSPLNNSDVLNENFDEDALNSGEKLKGKFNCSECGKRYSTSSNLSRHKQTHRSLDSQAAKRCGECGKAYVSMPALAMHVLTHRMSHVCGVCGKQFSRPWLLRGHLRSHTGEKPYSCECCGKAFADRSNLRSHLQTHSSEKRWDCVRCNKTFALKSYLNKHQEAACVQD